MNVFPNRGTRPTGFLEHGRRDAPKRAVAERVADCGGSFRVDTDAGGTVVRATFPLGDA